MKTFLHHLKVVILLVMTLPLISTECCEEEEDEPNIMVRHDIFVVNAGIHQTCDSAINFSGNHVFGYRYQWPDTDEVYLLVGGYTPGDSMELGFFLPWPPVVGKYEAFEFMAYFDPHNDDENPNNGDDQYGSSGLQGWVMLESFTMYADSSFDKITVSFNQVDVVNISGEHLCLNSGLIKKNYFFY